MAMARTDLTSAAGKVERMIVYLRGQGVILDKDLARLYGAPTKALVQAANRNRARFPPDFMFQLTTVEFEFLRSQFVTSNGSGSGGRRYRPYAFTEQGVAMLSSVLRSRRAVAANIEIMRAFVRLRKLVMAQAELVRKLGERFRRAVLGAPAHDLVHRGSLSGPVLELSVGLVQDVQEAPAARARILALEDNRLYTARVRFEWDPPKAEANRRTHGVSFAEAVTVLEDDFALTRDDADPAEESALRDTGAQQLGEPARRGVHIPERRRHTLDLGMESEQTPEDAL